MQQPLGDEKPAVGAVLLGEDALLGSGKLLPQRPAVALGHLLHFGQGGFIQQQRNLGLPHFY